MSQIPDEEIDHWAAEYALGTLVGDRREIFERILETNDIARTSLQQWEIRLAGLADQVTPQSPPKALWPRIDAAISKVDAVERPNIDGTAIVTKLRRSLQVWRFAAGGAALTAVGLVLFLIGGTPDIPGRDGMAFTAVLQSDQPTPTWFVEVYPEAAEIKIRPLQELAVQPGHDLELWAILPSAQNPLSLGILAHKKTTNIALSTSLSDALNAGITLAISIEPMGGSPSGLPTGPVVFTGSLQKSGLGGHE